jgi:hypothetical protein
VCLALCALTVSKRFEVLAKHLVQVHCCSKIHIDLLRAAYHALLHYCVQGELTLAVMGGSEPGIVRIHIEAKPAAAVALPETQRDRAGTDTL